MRNHDWRIFLLLRTIIAIKELILVNFRLMKDAPLISTQRPPLIITLLLLATFSIVNGEPDFKTSFELFSSYKYDGIDYLKDKSWHGFWHKEFNYDKNDKNYYIARCTPPCDCTKETLDCSKIGKNLKTIEIKKKYDMINITVDTFPKINSINTLEIVNTNIHTIEDGVFELLPNLQILIISKSKIIKVPKFPTQLKKLITVDLYDNEISWIGDEAFKHLSALSTLHLGANKISYISQDAFLGTPVEYVTLTNNFLTTMPALKGVSLSLKYLGLENNKISVVRSGTMKGLQSLVHLNISYNPVEEFEHDCFEGATQLRFLDMLGLTEPVAIPYRLFFNHAKIQHINMDYSKLSNIEGDAFESLAKLEGLSLRYSTLQGVDFRMVAGVNNVKRLWLDGNMLTKLQHGTLIHGQFSQLEELHLSNNQIDNMKWFSDDEFRDRMGMVHTSLDKLEPTGFYHLPHLKILNLQSNRVHTIEDGTFLGLSSLEQLILTNNVLDDLSVSDGAFAGLTSLWELKLDDNTLKSVPKGVYTLNKIRTLGMGSNKLTYLSKGDFATLENLQQLNLENNRILIIEDDTFPTKLRKLYLGNNEFKFVDENQFTGLINLDTLSLPKNDISYIPKDAFKTNAKLQHINLNQNNLKYINSSHFTNCPLTGNINFGNNQIAYIEEGSFTHVKQCVSINFSHNQLYGIPNDGMFNDLKVTLTIDLSYNRITQLKQDAFKNLKCSKLNLEKNSITNIASYALNNVKLTGYLPMGTLLFNDNPVRQLSPYAFSSVSGVTLANFRNLTPLSHIPSHAFSQFSAKELDLSNNRLEMLHVRAFDDVTITNLAMKGVGLKWLDRNCIVGTVLTLNLTDNLIRRIPESALYNIATNNRLYLQNNFIEIIDSKALPNSEEINLQNNNITLLTQSMFGRNQRTKTLRLMSNIISRAEDKVFDSMVNLNELQLGNNELDIIPDHMFSGLKSLERLVLANNKLVHFGAQSDLPKLEAIDFKNNKLSHIDSTLLNTKVPKLKIPLNNNQLSCGCELFSGLVDVKKAVEGAACNNPSHMRGVKLNAKEQSHKDYFTKIPKTRYVCEPYGLTAVKDPANSDTFILSWSPPDHLQLGQTTGSTDYCYNGDRLDCKDIKYKVYCADINNGVVFSKEITASTDIETASVNYDPALLPYFCKVKLERLGVAELESSFSNTAVFKVPPPEVDQQVII